METKTTNTTPEGGGPGDAAAPLEPPPDEPSGPNGVTRGSERVGAPPVAASATLGPAVWVNAGSWKDG